MRWGLLNTVISSRIGNLHNPFKQCNLKLGQGANLRFCEKQIVMPLWAFAMKCEKFAEEDRSAYLAA